MSARDRDEVRAPGAVLVPCSHPDCGPSGNSGPWCFWIDCLDPRLPDGPFVCQDHGNNGSFTKRNKMPSPLPTPPPDPIGELCAAVKDAGGTMRLHGQPVTEQQLRDGALASAVERLTPPPVTHEERNDRADHLAAGVVTFDEARAILRRFNCSHFGNHRRPGSTDECARYSIPADPRRDDDIRLGAFISAAAATAKRLAEVEAENTRLRAEIVGVVDLVDRSRKAYHYADQWDDEDSYVADEWSALRTRVAALRALDGGG